MAASGRRAHRLAGGVDVRAVELGEGAGEAIADLLARQPARGRADERVAVRALGGPLLQMRDQVGAGDGLGGDDQGVGHVPADRVVLDPDRDVGDRHVEALLRPLDQILARQPEAGVVQAREQDLAGREGADRVVEGEGRVGVQDRAHRLDPEISEDRLGHLDPALRRLAHLVAIDDLAGHRLVLGSGESDRLGARLDPLADRLEQLAPARDLVQEGQDGSAAPRSRAGALLRVPAPRGLGRRPPPPRPGR